MIMLCYVKSSLKMHHAFSCRRVLSNFLISSKIIQKKHEVFKNTSLHNLDLPKILNLINFDFYQF